MTGLGNLRMTSKPPTNTAGQAIVIIVWSALIALTVANATINADEANNATLSTRERLASVGQSLKSSPTTELIPLNVAAENRPQENVISEAQ